MRQVQRGQQSSAVRGTLESLVTVGFISIPAGMQRSEQSCNVPQASANQVGTQYSRENRSRRRPFVTAQARGTRYLADGEGAGRQRTGFRLRWFPPSAVQTRVDGDGKAGIQIHGPLQHECPFAFIASFHACTVTRVYRPDHWSEVLFGWAKGLLCPKPMGRLGPFGWIEQAFLDRPGSASYDEASFREG